MPEIRPARVDDAETLWKAEVETAKTPGLLVARPHELTVALFRSEIERLTRTGRYLVAVEDGRPVGHAYLSPGTSEAVAHVFRLTVVVHPGRAGRGLGTALLRALMDWARATPAARKIELNVRAGNAPAVALYRKLGFVEEGRLRARVRLPDGSFADDLAMAWFPPRTP